MDIISKMCGILLVIFSLIGASAAGMSQATTTREFRRCFPKSWVSADQVRVSCNDTLIAQNCSPDRSCRNMSKPGVSLEKGMDEVCLTITSCSYDSWSCEAQSYISDKEYKEKFTVSVCNQPTSTSSSPGHEPHSGSVEAVLGQIIIGVIIIGVIIIGLIIYFCYKKYFNKKQDMAERMEMGEKLRVNGTTGASGATGETGEREEMRANGATGALGASGATGETGEREEMGETGEVGDMRAREETEETEKLLPHTQNNTKCIRPNIL